MSSAFAPRPDQDGGEQHSDRPRRETVPVEVAASEWLKLASSGWYIRIDEVLDRPTSAQLATEDACWYFAHTDWEQRRPHRWQRQAHAEWAAEGERLDAKRARLVHLTRQVRTLRPQERPHRGR